MATESLNLYCDTMWEFRSSLNEKIKETVIAMKERDMREGVVTAQLKFRMLETFNGQKMVMKLNIEPKVGMKIGAKGKSDVPMVIGLCLDFDDTGMPIIGDNQISIDELLNRNQEGEKTDEGAISEAV